MELTIYNIKGEKTSRTITLNDSVFGIEPNDHAIYLDTKQYLANQRQGTHSALEKSTISGSTRKIKKQKGTGGARAGSIKSPLLVVEDFNFEQPKTRFFVDMLDKLQLSEKKTLMVLGASNNSLFLSSRNLKRARVIRACDLNTYEILKANNLIILESLLSEIEKTFEN